MCIAIILSTIHLLFVFGDHARQNWLPSHFEFSHYIKETRNEKLHCFAKYSTRNWGAQSSEKSQNRCREWIRAHLRFNKIAINDSVGNKVCNTESQSQWPFSAVILQYIAIEIYYNTGLITSHVAWRVQWRDVNSHSPSVTVSYSTTCIVRLDYRKWQRNWDLAEHDTVHPCWEFIHV